jgi:tRNA (mo5U34)-methyltransferase
MSAIDSSAGLLQPARVLRIARRRAATRIYPQVHRVRERIPRYSLYEQARRFYQQAEARGLGDLRAYSWYHTVDLGDGLVTPGTYDHRGQLSEFNFPEDMSGMNVLDIGSATGFFAFEFERRGANVVSVDVPSIADFDRFPFEDPEETLEKLSFMARDQSAYTPAEHEQVFGHATPEDIYRYVVDGPFKLCHQVLKSKVERRYARIYDVADTDLGHDQFDLVFVGDVVVHTLHPVEALAAVSKVCKGTLVITQHTFEGLGSRPAALYVGGEKLGEPNLTWWVPNQACLEQLLKKVGFRDVDLVGHNTGAMRPGGVYYDRPILHARK